jgi:hypothetical protein
MLNTFLLGAFHGVLYLGNHCYMYTKSPMVHSPMRRRDIILRLMQMLEKMNEKKNHEIKERRNIG